MSERRIDAIKALGRWRAFQQALAERHRWQASRARAEAQDALAQTRAAAVAIARRRQAMLTEARLDPAHLQFVAGIEQRAWDAVAEHDAYMADAEIAERVAREKHRVARIRVRVVDARRDRQVAAEVDRREKQQFDRIAALRAATVAGERDD